MQPNRSLAESLSLLPASERAALLSELATTEAEHQALLYDWTLWARPKQLAPTWDWRTWLLLAGRGFGKTRTLCEWAIDAVRTKGYRRQALIGATAGDVRDILVEGESGILAIAPPWFTPIYQPSKLRLIWPNGAKSYLYSAEEPDRLRGKQHDCAGADEIAAWRYEDAWDQLQFGLRLGHDPRVVAATTPRPTALIRRLIADPKTALTHGSTYENKGNLADAFIGELIKRYEGTRLGQQELEALVLDDTPGALWNRALIERSFVRVFPTLVKIVVAVDPSASDAETADEAGIVVFGLGEDGHGYVLEDLSGRMSPTEWATRAIQAAVKWRANYVVGEVNQGGDMVKTIVDQTARVMREQGKLKQSIAFKAVHAKQGKRARAEPVSALYEQGRIHHVGAHAGLEDQQCTWDATSTAPSPDRLDALVYGATECCLHGIVGGPAILPLTRR